MELSAVCELGKKKKEDIVNSGGDVLKLFIDNPNNNGAYNTVLEITIDKEFNYKGINVSEFNKDLTLKYLYKKGSTNGADYTPTSKITTPEKTFNKKILKCFTETIKDYSKHKEIEEIRGIYQSLENNSKVILKDLKDNITSSKNGYILTVVYDEKFVGDLEIFKDKVKKETIKSYYLIDKKESKGKDKYCSICKELKDEVFGNANIFKFYTVDKRGYVSGGFNKLDSWRNFPVCKECAIDLELGKKYLDEALSFKFQGRDFYLIPKLLYRKKLGKILKSLSNIDNDIDSEYQKVEEMVMKRLSKFEDYATFDMLFYEVNNSALNIKLDIQEILPSRFKKIYDDMEKINVVLKTNEKSEKIRTDFSFLSTLFPRKTYNRYFLESIDIIISDKEIDYKFIIQHICNHIIEKFNQDEGKYYYFETIKSYAFLMYLRLLGVLFKERGTVNLMKEFKWNIKDYNSKEEMFENIFNDNMDFFTTPDKKAVFLIGFLSQKLLNLQYIKEKRKPFIARLKGLKLNKKDIRRLLPEIQNKFIEYEGDYYRDIQALASKYLLEAGEKWTISQLDIPFYFSIGMNLERHIILKNEKEEEINE